MLDNEGTSCQGTPHDDDDDDASARLSAKGLPGHAWGMSCGF